MRPQLTARQSALLKAIREYWENAGISPTLAEAGRMAGISSTSVVRHHLDVLEGRGYIRRTDGIARSIVLVEPVRIPAGVRGTLLRALQTEQHEYGKSEEIAEAKRWLNGDTGASHAR